MKKTKVLLIYPFFTVSPSDYPTPDPPLGLGYLAAVLEKHQYPVKILDALALGIEQAKKIKGGLLRVGLSEKEIRRAITDFQPDIVGISCAFTIHAANSHEIAALVKKVNQKILVVFGGAHATACSSLVLKDKNVEVVVLGEGEMTFLDLVDHIDNKQDIRQVQGTCQKKGGKIIVNPRREYIANLDDLPDVAWHLLPMDKYLEKRKMTREFSMRHPRINIITSRGCPGNCIFCSIHAIWGHCWRPRSPERVVSEMEFLVKNYGVREFYVLDDNVSIRKDRLMKICELIIAKKLNIRWAPPNGVALWTLDRELLSKMKKSGLYRITFGIESACQKSLKFIRKPMNLAKAEEIIKISNDLGLWTHSTFIIGFSEETGEDIEQTVNWAINSDLDFASFYIATPYPGTDLKEEFIRLRLLKRGDEEKMNYSSISVSGYDTVYFKRMELNCLRDEAYSRFFMARVKRYLNPFYSLPRLSKRIQSFEEFIYFFRLLDNVLGMKIKAKISGKFQSHLK